MDAPTGLALIADALRCPVCGADVVVEPVVVECAAGHRFDIARQGYVSLLAGSRRLAGDTAEMVAAREAFLGLGHYDRIADAVAGLVPDAGGLIVDLGGGTGHHLARVLDARPRFTGVVVDSSAAAARRAARAHPRAAAIVADVWAGVPLADACAAVVLSVFAPRNAAETARILAPGGLLVVVTPTPDHLHELVEPLGMLRVDDRKGERLAAQLAGFAEAGRERLDHLLDLDRRAVRDEVMMGPSAHHVDGEALTGALAALPEPIRVTVSVDIAAFRVR